MRERQVGEREHDDQQGHGERKRLDRANLGVLGVENAEHLPREHTQEHPEPDDQLDHRLGARVAGGGEQRVEHHQDHGRAHDAERGPHCQAALLCAIEVLERRHRALITSLRAGHRKPGQ
jgi:hypothetical protein